MLEIKVIGITGGIATGKSTVGQILRRSGNIVISSDELAHQAIEPGQQAYQEVIKRFGEGILNKDGTIDRSLLGKIVFSDPQSRKELEEMIHPKVLASIKEQSEYYRSKGYKMIFVEVPLLFEAGLEYLFDKIVVVTAGVDQQLARLQARNKYSRAEAQTRIAAQLSLTEKEGKADFIVYNNGSLEELEKEIRLLLNKLE